MVFIRCERLILTTEFIQAVEGSNPQRAGVIFKNRPDPITVQAIGIFRRVPITRKGLLFSIKAIESAAISANPQETLTIFKE